MNCLLGFTFSQTLMGKQLIELFGSSKKKEDRNHENNATSEICLLENKTNKDNFLHTNNFTQASSHKLYKTVHTLYIVCRPKVVCLLKIKLLVYDPRRNEMLNKRKGQLS